MICKFADFYFDIESYTDSFASFCEKYIVNDAPRIDCKIKICKDDIRYEYETGLRVNGTHAAVKEYDRLAVYRKVCAYSLLHDAFLMHCAVIEYKGKGYAFSALSGTGKTTHIGFWKKRFGEGNVTIVNGDKPIIRFIDGKVYAYGTPWNGKEGYGTNGRVELCGIAFIERAKQNSIEKLTAEQAVPLCFSQIMISDSANLAKQLELVDALLQKVPIYKLKCNMSEVAAEVAYTGMFEGR